MGVPTSRLLNPTGAASAAVNPSFEFGGNRPASLGQPQPIALPTFPTLNTPPPVTTLAGSPQLTPQEVMAIQQKIQGMGTTPYEANRQSGNWFPGGF